MSGDDKLTSIDIFVHRYVIDMTSMALNAPKLDVEKCQNALKNRALQP